MSDEEAAARRLLQQMQARLAEGPHATLGIPKHATPADIRSAFLQLTKVYHPARFGRMTAEVQRLSNEIFLSLRAAHDQLAKVTKPSGRSASTTGSPVVRSPTRPFGVPASPATRPSVPPTPARPSDRQSGAIPPVRAGDAAGRPMPTSRQTGAIPVVRPAPPQGPPPQHPGSRPANPTGLKFAAPTGSQGVRAAASSATMQALDPALAPFLELLGRGEWARAQTTIDALVTRNPQNKRYAAYAAYARGRRAMAEGDVRGAGIEFNTALGLDPQNDLAKSAIGELMRRK